MVLLDACGWCQRNDQLQACEKYIIWYISLKSWYYWFKQNLENKVEYDDQKIPHTRKFIVTQDFND